MIQSISDLQHVGTATDNDYHFLRHSAMDQSPILCQICVISLNYPSPKQKVLSFLFYNPSPRCIDLMCCDICFSFLSALIVFFPAPLEKKLQRS